ncbi:carbohydrate ABC transporter permease [uncultured Leifsonia sp.]|uniref:carbohydrate ABC transporter permease n=1 Tax=uncultured Leifsonia sp. TaxID=340359 RepID=UPI0028D6FE35|nr:carbohydrate ABC transporter permease [uncultured Leifsonia sp.]
MSNAISRHRSKVTPLQIVGIAILAVGAIGMVAPFLWMFITALKPASAAYDLPPNWIPLDFEWGNFLKAINGPLPLLTNMFNSLLIAVITTLGLLITAPMAGYAFARLEFPGRNAMFVALLASLMVPIQVTIIPLFLIMRNLGLINTPWSLILPSITWALGVFLMRQFFLTLPKEILEAAKIDGAGPWTTYRLIALPLVKNGLSALGVIAFLNSWNAYFAPSIFLNSQDTATLPLALVLMRGPFSTGQVNVIMAATALAVIPALVVFLIAQRWIIASMTQSGVKG